MGADRPFGAASTALGEQISCVTCHDELLDHAHRVGSCTTSRLAIRKAGWELFEHLVVPDLLVRAS